MAAVAAAFKSIGNYYHALLRSADKVVKTPNVSTFVDIKSLKCF